MVRGTGIEESGRSMCEITFGYEIVHLNNPVHVRAVGSDGDSHDHVLRSFSDAPIDAKEVEAFESFEPETRKRLAQMKQKCNIMRPTNCS